MAVFAATITAAGGFSGHSQAWASPFLSIAPIEVSIGPGRSHTYRLVLDPGLAAQVLLEQGESNLRTVVVGPTPITMRSTGSPIDVPEHGRELVNIVNANAVRTKFELRVHRPAVAGPPASYAIRLAEAPSPPTDLVRERARLERETTNALDRARSGGEPGRVATVHLRQLSTDWGRIENDKRKAMVLSLTGDRLQARGEFSAALEFYREALPLAEAAPQDLRLATEILNNQGVSAGQVGDLLEARRSLPRALQGWRDLRLPDKEGRTLLNHGALDFQSANYSSAADRFEAAIKVLISAEDARGLAAAQTNLGVVKRSLGDSAAALSALRAAVTTAMRGGEDSLQTRARLHLAITLLASRAVGEARSEIALARQLILRTPNALFEADAIDLLGLVEAASGEPGNAISYHDDALQRYQQLGARRGEAAAFHHRGLAYLATARLADAKTSFEQALEIRRSVGLQDAVAETLLQLSIVARMAGELELARDRVQQAIQILEEVRGRVAGEYSRSTYLAVRQSYFVAGIDVLMDMHQRDESGGYDLDAFSLSERQKARGLLDLLALSEGRAADNDEAVVRDLRDRQDQMNLWAHRLWTLSNQGKNAEAAATQARRTLDEKVEAFRALASKVQGQASAFAELDAIEPLTATEVRRLLAARVDANTCQPVLLRYVLSEPQSYVWVVSGKTFRAVRLGRKAEIESLARDFHALVSTHPDQREGGEPRLTFVGSELGKALFADVTADVRDRCIAIVADGALQLIPFAAVPAPGGGGPMIHHHQVSVLPSATTLAALDRRRGRGTTVAARSLIVANAVTDQNDSRLESTSREGASPLPQLPFGSEETRRLRQLIPAARVFEGFAASREKLWSEPLHYRFAHFSVHAQPDNSHPELSYLALSMFNSDGTSVDGFLRSHDIADLRLKAQLVTLAACKTASGKDVPGEGLMTISRAFLVAGTDRVIAAVFDVPDSGTAQLMPALYANLIAKQLTPAAALRQAQLSLLDEGSEGRWSDPYNWAGFVLTGDPR